MNAISKVATIMITLAAMACQKTASNEKNQVKDFKEGTFGYDVAFLKQHQEIIEITASDDSGAIAMVIPGYQGRVMTSTADGESGYSYGWINYELIKSGVNQPHMNAFGGEERFWLSPEGGQFSVYFKKNAPFNFENWQTPAIIDTVGYKVVERTASSVSVQASTKIENHSGTSFSISIDRSVSMLDKKSILAGLDLTSLGDCRSVAYESVNTVTNEGAGWTEDKGMLGIWLLGMFRPSDKTVIVAPFTTRYEAKPQITDNYFGKIPSDRIAVKDSTLFLKADGKHRSKIGIAPKSAKNIAGSYDSEKNVLTIIQFSLDRDQKYLKSTWEIHKDPYAGDALNAYNDGKLEDGTQMGPFYELESNSSVRALKNGEQIRHSQKTYHFEGDKASLDHISQKVLGLSLASIEGAFEVHLK